MMRKMTRGYKRGGGVKKTTTKNTSTQEKEAAVTYSKSVMRAAAVADPMTEQLKRMKELAGIL